MRLSTCKSLFASVIAALFVCLASAQAQQAPRAQPEQPAPETAAQAPNAEPDEPQEATTEQDDLELEPSDDDRRGRGPSRKDIVSIGHDSVLAAGERAGAVVAVFGSATSAGEASEVVAVLGNARVTGPAGEVVAVIGDVYVNSRVRGDVVSVLGSVELGPQAEVGGDVVSALGSGIKRDPAAVIRGGTHDVAAGLEWLRPWIQNCLALGRPLALEPGLGWAWTLALGFLALYALMAVMFRESMDKCVSTFDEHPGHSLLTALLAVLLTPVLIVVLCVTIVGIVVVPFLGLALFIATLFGKAIMLAWIGRRCIRSYGHTAVAVLVGGVIVLAVYLVPIAGFLVYKLLGIIGFGVVVYTLILNAKNTRRERLAATANGVVMSIPADAPMGATDQPAAGVAPAVPPERMAAGLPRAGFWIRMGALLIDAILIGIVVGILSDEQQLYLPLLATYGALMWKMRGTTVGGIVCNLQVVRLDGREIDWPTAAVRALSCFLSLVVAGLGFIWMVFDDERQTWHDKIAGTVVVRVPKGMSLL